MENVKDIASINEDLNVVKYEVETKRVNEAVKRNIRRFPEEFCFQLSEKEYNSLKSQIATLKTNENMRSQFATASRKY